jgi:hypothetical protein
MLCNVRWKKVALPLAAFAAMLTLACFKAEAQEKLFKIKGKGIAPDGLPLPGQEPRPHWIKGEATYLGRHTGLGSVKTDTAVPDGKGHITGEFSYSKRRTATSWPAITAGRIWAPRSRVSST